MRSRASPSDRRARGRSPDLLAMASAGLARPRPTPNLFWGALIQNAFLVGRGVLEEEASRNAIQTSIATPLKITPELSAFAISENVEENMANAARLHATERGLELFDRTLIATGGCAPLHAARLAEKLGVETVVI